MATQYTAQDFTDLLKLPKGYKQFKKYVQTGKWTAAQPSTDHEGALELDFWYEIECFKKDATLAYAQAMLNTYMNKIPNMADSHKQEIQAKVDSKQIDPTMFDNIQRDVFGIMRIQLFRDYAKTSEYQGFKAEVAEMREAALAALANANINSQGENNNNNNNSNGNGSTSPTLNQANNLNGDKPKAKLKVKRIMKDPTDKPRKTCMKLLKDRQGNEIFRNFLDSIFASESIDFWNGVEIFRKVCLENPAKLHGRAMAIYEQYLAPNSPKEINVDSETRQTVFHKLRLSLFDTAVFDALQDSIFNLLSSDSFPKFAVTSEYKQWKRTQTKRSMFGFAVPDMPTVVQHHSPITRTLSPTRSPPPQTGEKGETIVYVDKQMCLNVLQDMQGCIIFRGFIEMVYPGLLRHFDCWAEMELFRITVNENPLGCYTLARNVYYKYIETGATLDVGLNVHICGYLQEKITLSLFEPTLFIHAQGELLEKLKEPFMKFTLTEEYKDYRSQLNTKKKKSSSLRNPRKQLNPAQPGFNMYIEVLTKKELGIKS